MSEQAKPQPEPRSAYRAFRTIATRWMDNDAYGHVNNVVYYSWFDTAVNAHLIEQGALENPHVDAVFGHLMLEGIGPGSETRDMPRGRNVFWPTEVIAECWPKALLVGGHYHVAQVFSRVNVVGSLARLTRGEVGSTPQFLEIGL